MLFSRSVCAGNWMWISSSAFEQVGHYWIRLLKGTTEEQYNYPTRSACKNIDAAKSANESNTLSNKTKLPTIKWKKN